MFMIKRKRQPQKLTVSILQASYFLFYHIKQKARRAENKASPAPPNKKI